MIEKGNKQPVKLLGNLQQPDRPRAPRSPIQFARRYLQNHRKPLAPVTARYSPPAFPASHLITGHRPVAGGPCQPLREGRLGQSGADAGTSDHFADRFIHRTSFALPDGHLFAKRAILPPDAPKVAIRMSHWSQQKLRHSSQCTSIELLDFVRSGNKNRQRPGRSLHMTQRSADSTVEWLIGEIIRTHRAKILSCYDELLARAHSPLITGELARDLHQQAAAVLAEVCARLTAADPPPPGYPQSSAKRGGPDLLWAAGALCEAVLITVTEQL